MSPLRRRLLVALEVFVAVGAAFGGSSMLRDPTGGLIGFPAELLTRTPFPSYFVPGLVLLVVVGGSQAAAVVAALLRQPAARWLGGGAGAVLLGWILVQIALLGYVSWLQPLLFGLGAAEVAIAWSPERVTSMV
jgi:hypothetical protein